ncbi:MAG: HAMP domain-containing histidine kinase [Caulobacteraceae bacterium]|nr:HAMP domain-containing histidine kinase [Caulobacter sp.]
MDAIAATAERIAGGDLSARTAIADTRDPFGRVGASLNAMLERIEELLTGMRTVTDSLAHDLRSPLTRMEGALARALHAGATEDERLDAIEAAHGEVGRTLATLSALLDIARAETGLSREMMGEVDLSALVAEMAEVFAPAIEDAGQSLRVPASPTPVRVTAHEALLRQAVGNLLHNASLYAGEGAEVCIDAEASAAGAQVTVSDTGVGVPADQRGRVQERFVRLDPARGVGGSGLGLAIVAACAKLHRGALELEDNAPGLRAVLSITDMGQA